MAEYDTMRKETQPKQKLLTNTKLLAVFFVQLNEAYQISVLLPIVVFMCRDFGITPKWLGVYTSILNAAFGFCQFTVSYLWGYLSDIYGRRNILMCGLFGTFVSMTIFGFSSSYIMAMICRCMTGFFNGNLGVVKAYLADITDSSNRGFAFSIIGVSFGVGVILGSMLGGILIETNDVDVSDEEYIKTESVLKYWLFESTYPYLLPTSICGGFISINALLWTFVFIKDERQTFYNSNAAAGADTNSTVSVDTIEMTSNLTAQSMKEMDDSLQQKEGEYLAMHQSLPTYAEFKAMTSNGNDMISRKYLLGKLRESRSVDFTHTNDDYNDANALSTVSDLLTKTFFAHALLQYGIAAISHMMFKEMGPVFMAQALLFDSIYIGYSQAFAGAVLFIFTLFIQPIALRHFNHRKLQIFCCLSCFVCTLLMPSIYYFTQIDAENEKYGFMTNSVWLLMMTFVVEMFVTMGVSVVFVVASCWVNNSVPQHALGKANGVGQSMAAFVRGFGPLLTGFIWSESFVQIERDNISYAVYYAYLPGAILYIVASIDCLFYIPSNLQFTWEQREKDKQTSWK